MATITWDEPEARRYESGIDRGVLYLTDGFGVAWNGLISMEEESELDVTPIHFDGFKVNDFVTLGSFAGTLTAYTYPDEFFSYEGFAQVRNGILLADQPLKTFALSYRTMVGNSVDGQAASYKIHIVYNLTAIPSGKSYDTISDDPEAVEFEWELTAVPNEITGFRQTAHMIIDSRIVDQALLKDIEDSLYGTENTHPKLIGIEDLVGFLDGWFRLQIVDHGDGTWSAIEKIDGDYIHMLSADEFEIVNANAGYLDSDTYKITSISSDLDLP